MNLHNLGEIVKKNMKLEDIIKLSLWYRKKKQLKEQFSSSEAISIGYNAYLQLKKRYDSTRCSVQTCFVNYLSYEYSKEIQRKQAIVYVPKYKWTGSNNCEKYRPVFVDLDTITYSKNEAFTYDDRSELLRKNITKLNHLEQNIIIKKYGLFDERVHTFQELGKIYNYSYQYIERTEKRAIKKLKAIFSPDISRACTAVSSPRFKPTRMSPPSSSYSS